MNKYVPVEKMSKKARREYYQARRGSWGALSPVTRKPPSPKAYHREREKIRREEKFFDAGSFFIAQGFRAESGGPAVPILFR